MKLKYLYIIIAFTLSQAFGQVKYDEGRIQIGDVQLLQDSNDENAYYYLTRMIRLATKDDGSYELLCMKYIGEGENRSGGIFHALVEFSLPEDVVKEVEKKLKEEVNGKAYIAGPVPMKQVVDKNTNEVGTFNLVSSILTNTEGEDAFTNNVVTSGFSPLLPGSKAAIAANLTAAGATLLWESLSGPTSDVSVSIHGYYEAKVKGYNAIVSAEAKTIYEHYSMLSNYQEGYTKDQLRDISDKMIKNQILKVEVFDRAEGLGIKNGDMQGIVNIVTDKLIALMFDAKTGWSKEPKTEVAVEAGQIKGRQKKGFLRGLFGGNNNARYYTDNQYVVKKRKDIRINTFYLNLSKSTTIKVPTYTSGNIGGLYDEMKNDERYFRVVNLDDPDFEKRQIHFQIDGGFSDAFNDVLNSVSVSFRKVYGKDKDDATDDLFFTNRDLSAGKDFKTVFYPRLGFKGSNWLNYEYKISWNLKGAPKPIIIPQKAGEWKPGDQQMVTLVPPFKKKIIDIDGDRIAFKEAGYKSATIWFFTVLDNKPNVQRTVILREADTENTTKAILYHDEGEPLAYVVTWYGKNGSHAEKIKELREDYLFLSPPPAQD